MDALDSATKIEERIVMKATQANIPLGGTFELTPLCNMNCDMCFIRLSKNEMDQRGQLKTGKEWLEIARQMKEEGTLFVLLTGGEPLLHPDFIEIYQGLRKLGMIITINTNGTLVTKEIAEVLGKDKPRRVNITLYGASNETYDKLCHNPKGYDQTMIGIQLLMEQHIDIKLNGSIVPLNYHEINDLQNIANQLNLYIKMDTYMFPGYRERFKKFNEDTRLTPMLAAKCDVEIKKLQLGEDHFELYKNEYLSMCLVDGKNDYCGLSCRAGKSAFWITWNGLMTSCVFLKHISKDVFKEGFKTCWDYLVKEYKNVCMPESCLSCQHREVCQVCGASVYTETDGLEEKPTYLCEYTKEIIDLLRNEVKNEKD